MFFCFVVFCVLLCYVFCFCCAMCLFVFCVLCGFSIELCCALCSVVFLLSGQSGTLKWTLGEKGPSRVQIDIFFSKNTDGPKIVCQNK